MKWFRHLLSKFRGDISPESISAACDAVIEASRHVERAADIWRYKEANERLTTAIETLTEELKEIRKAKL